MDQDILDNTGFSLDLIYMAKALGCQNSLCTNPTGSPEAEQLEELLRAVLTAAEAE